MINIFFLLYLCALQTVKIYDKNAQDLKRIKSIETQNTKHDKVLLLTTTFGIFIGSMVHNLIIYGFNFLTICFNRFKLSWAVF